MTDIRVIALDLDGTLLNSRKELTPRTYRALQAAAEAGIEIVPTTGRFFDGMPKAVQDLPFLHYAITINGARVTDLRTGEVVSQAEIPLETALAVMERLDKLPVIYDCYQDNWGWMTRSLYDRSPEFVQNPHILRMVQELRTPVDDLKTTLRQRGRGVQKIQFFVKDMAVRQEVLDTFEGLFPGLAVTSSLANNVEINDRRANKGDALQALAAYMGIGVGQTMSFGDGLNDLTMIRAAGIGVAMANSCPEVLAAADRVAPSCDEDGVAAVIEKLLGE